MTNDWTRDEKRIMAERISRHCQLYTAGSSFCWLIATAVILAILEVQAFGWLRGHRIFQLCAIIIPGFLWLWRVSAFPFREYIRRNVIGCTAQYHLCASVPRSTARVDVFETRTDKPISCPRCDTISLLSFALVLPLGGWWRRGALWLHHPEGLDVQIPIRLFVGWLFSEVKNFNGIEGIFTLRDPQGSRCVVRTSDFLHTVQTLNRTYSCFQDLFSDLDEKLHHLVERVGFCEQAIAHLRRENDKLKRASAPTLN